MCVDIFIVGAGSVGSFLAARLFSQASVTLIARERIASCWQDGVKLVGSEERHVPVPVVPWSKIQSFPDNSFIFLTNKIFSFEEVFTELSERVSRGCSIVLCQNGLGVMEEARLFFPQGDFVRAVCWLGVRLETPPFVRVAGVDGVEFGSATDLKILMRFFDQSNLPTVWSSDIKLLEWKKALWNVSANGLCALAGVKNGEVLENPLLRPLFEGLLDEAIQVAAAEGVKLTVEDRERVIQATLKTKNNFNSTYQDLKANRPTEMPWLNGALVKMAQKHRIPVPRHQMIDALVSVAQILRD